jgi:electron transport complex protein RnfD
MLQVVFALIPGALLMALFFGWGVISNLVFAILATLGLEACMLLLRGRDLTLYITDCSALVTACLLALALPPLSPWWLMVVAAFAAIVVAKQLYGGLGYNPFNPAMVGYVVVLVSFPVELTTWIAPLGLRDTGMSVMEGLRMLFGSQLQPIDGLTAATPLDVVKTEVKMGRTLSEIYTQPLFGWLGGAGWQWVNLGFLAGGIWLLHRGVIRWQIPIALLASLFTMATVFWIADPEIFPSPVFHLFTGATMLGAFFIATDPVSAATTVRGRIWFGIGAGVLIYVIRTWGAYPDGVAFAVLLMNLAAPALDHWNRPRVLGEPEG